VRYFMVVVEGKQSRGEPTWRLRTRAIRNPKSGDYVRLLFFPPHPETAAVARILIIQGDASLAGNS
jgi:hypothetical protein